MENLLSGVPWATIGPWGLLGLMMWLIVRLVASGNWLPRTTHELIVDSKNEAISRLSHSNERLTGALASLAEEKGTTADKVLSALPLPKEVDDA